MDVDSEDEEFACRDLLVVIAYGCCHEISLMVSLGKKGCSIPICMFICWRVRFTFPVVAIWAGISFVVSIVPSTRSS